MGFKHAGPSRAMCSERKHFAFVLNLVASLLKLLLAQVSSVPRRTETESKKGSRRYHTEEEKAEKEEAERERERSIDRSMDR